MGDTTFTKDQKASRRKRTDGIISKGFELSQFPHCEVVIVVEWKDSQRIQTYNSASGNMLKRLREFMQNKNRRYADARWEDFRPSDIERRILERKKKSKGKGCQRKKRHGESAQPTAVALEPSVPPNVEKPDQPTRKPESPLKPESDQEILIPDVPVFNDSQTRHSKCWPSG